MGDVGGEVGGVEELMCGWCSNERSSIILGEMCKQIWF